jgi:hypothetical protein
MKTITLNDKTATWIYVVASVLAGGSLAWGNGYVYALWAIPAFFCFKGLDAFSRSLPESMKPFAPLLSVAALFGLGILVMYLLAQAPEKPQSISTQSAPAESREVISRPASSVLESADAMTKAMIENPDPEAGPRLFGLFIAELNQRSVSNPEMDKVGWMKAMQVCVELHEKGGDNQLIDAHKMNEIAKCADGKMADLAKAKID